MRRYPGSRRLPHFGSSVLEAGLAASGIDYRWLPSLGGRRHATADSVNTGWRNAGFRGYADHIATEEFAEGLFELLTIGEGLRAAVMCAELLWWRCHRRLISDVLSSFGIQVVHIRDSVASEEHKIVPPARVAHGVLTYAEDTQLALLVP